MARQYFTNPYGLTKPATSPATSESFEFTEQRFDEKIPARRSIMERVLAAECDFVIANNGLKPNVIRMSDAAVGEIVSACERGSLGFRMDLQASFFLGMKIIRVSASEVEGFELARELEATKAQVEVTAGKNPRPSVSLDGPRAIVLE